MKNKKLSLNFITVTLVALVLITVLVFALIRNNGETAVVDLVSTDLVEDVQPPADDSKDVQPAVEPQPIAVETPEPSVEPPAQPPAVVSQSTPSTSTAPTPTPAAPAPVQQVANNNDDSAATPVKGTDGEEVTRIIVRSSATETGTMNQSPGGFSEPQEANPPVLANQGQSPQLRNNPPPPPLDGGIRANQDTPSPTPTDGKPANYCYRGCVDWYHSAGPQYSLYQCSWNAVTGERECELIESGSDPAAFTCRNGPII